MRARRFHPVEEPPLRRSRGRSAQSPRPLRAALAQQHLVRVPTVVPPFALLTAAVLRALVARLPRRRRARARRRLAAAVLALVCAAYASA